MCDVLSPREPFALMLTEEDRLRVDVWNTASNNTIRVSGVFFTERNEASPFLFTPTITTDGSQQTSRFFCGLSVLQFLTVSTASISLKPGQTFVRVLVEHGAGPDPVVLTQLTEGYVTDHHNLKWPSAAAFTSTQSHNFLTTLTSADPAAGAEITFTVPANAQLDVSAVRFTLTTSVAAANRQVHVVVDDGATVLYDAPANAVQAASLTRNYNVTFQTAQPAATDNEIYIAMPIRSRLSSGFRIRTATTALQAGDDFSAMIVTAERYLV